MGIKALASPDDIVVAGFFELSKFMVNFPVWRQLNYDAPGYGDCPHQFRQRPRSRGN
jgi:hypothetical protein